MVYINDPLQENSDHSLVPDIVWPDSTQTLRLSSRYGPIMQFPPAATSRPAAEEDAQF